jgi:NSS family neurotransmitter:Na+ symporter
MTVYDVSRPPEKATTTFFLSAIVYDRVLLLIPIQAIIFGWIYGLENVLPVLNENSSIRVGRIWVATIKYVAPVVFFILWFIAICELFSDANTFELAVDVIIIVSVLLISYIFTNRKSLNK